VITPDRAAWRPMGFGHRRAADIRDPLIEPLWEGIRVLAHLAGGAVVLVDETGDDVTDRFDDVAAALQVGVAAESAVLDGYLSTQATESGEGAKVVFVETPTAGQMVGQMFMGKSGERALGGSDAPKRRAATSDVVAFVAVDLLEVDGTEMLDVPLLERRRILESVLAEGEQVRRGIFVRPPASSYLVSWPSLGFTRMTYKAQNGRYRPGAKADDWTIAQIPRRR
jgi:bifunctional non-homologous end joining protein LigD